MPALFAFLHHAAAFALVAALTAELVLLKGEIDAGVARRLRAVDAAYGLAALALLLVGFARVLWFEKGAAYYFYSAPFVAKLVLFVAMGLLSIVPTLEFLAWGKLLRQGRAPTLAPERRRRLRLAIHAELTAMLLILLCAALMAKGVGYLG